MAYVKLRPPAKGEKITMGADQKLNVPDRPIIPYIEGDGTGPDIWAAAVKVFDAAVQKAPSGWCGRPSTGRWPINGRASLWCTRVIS